MNRVIAVDTNSKTISFALVEDSRNKDARIEPNFPESRSDFRARVASTAGTSLTPAILVFSNGARPLFFDDDAGSPRGAPQWGSENSGGGIPSRRTAAGNPATGSSSAASGAASRATAATGATAQAGTASRCC